MRAVALVAACAAVAAGLAGCRELDIPLPPAGTPAPPPTSIAGLAVAPQSHAGSYRRAAFGQSWKDVDHDGCGQRDDVLARDLREVRRRSRCVVVAGVLTDPYTGEVVTFTKARAEQVQIDHRVSLADAWRSGAWRWTTAQREVFANDLGNLIATAGPVNEAKADQDAGTWSPVGPVRACGYARAVVSVKARYGLSADPAEAAALSRMLAACP